MSNDELDSNAWQSLRIEWDETKRLANVAKHAIDFLDAIEIFNDPNKCTFAALHAHERRYVTPGRLRDIVAAVIWTRRGEKLRIISIRRARRGERKHYDQQR